VPDIRRPTVPTYAVCSVPIAAIDAPTAAARIVADALSRVPCEVHLCNAYTLSLVDDDAQMRTALLAADLNLADGTPVAVLGRRHGLPGPVRGTELVGEVARQGVADVRHYLYGGNEGVADLMAAELARTVPGASVVGTECPPFRPLTDDDLSGLVDRVRASGANVLWIGLGTPRQDYLVHLLAPQLSIPVVPVGAAFDFWSGTIKEAPRFLRGTGLEWVYRLAKEPRRLWRRYLLGNPRFVLSAWRHRG
jgi:N-acetylglucosaminyldiphosphoundecaprenol N-acetyl-beta-D-mannosaminyltransferase